MEVWQYNALPLISHGAMINFIDTVRNVGKTTTFKRRAILRAVKHDRGTYWLRRTDDEMKAQKTEFWDSETVGFIQKNCPQITDLDVHGCFARIKTTKSKNWHNAFKLLALCNARDERSNRDQRFNEMIYEEYRVTPDRLSFFRGNEAEMLIDMIITKGRRDDFRVYCLGNAESYFNPYLSYLGIPEMPVTWEGIRMYKDNTIAVQQIITKPKALEDSRQMKRINSALAGTRYAAYLDGSTVRSGVVCNIRKKPKDAEVYMCVDFGNPFTIWLSDSGEMYVTPGVVTGKPVLLNAPLAKYSRGVVYDISDKSKFSLLAKAKRYCRIYFSNGACGEYAAPVIDKIT